MAERTGSKRLGAVDSNHTEFYEGFNAKSILRQWLARRKDPRFSPALRIHEDMSSTTLLFIAALLIQANIFQTSDASQETSPHICLIGAGITAATISHFLTEPTLTPTPHITVFERSSRVGGRVATVTLPTAHKLVDIEAGASIIADANLLMHYFVDTLKLTRRSTEARTLGLWDGNEFVFRTVSGEGATRSKLRFAKRYGLSLVRMQRYVAEMLEKYGRVYPAHGAGAEWEAYASAQDLFQRSGMLYNLSQLSFAEVMKQKFSARLYSELVAAITRVNYGQDPSQINAFAGSVALAGSGNALWAVSEGNVRVVQGLLERSGVEILMNTTVQSVKAQAVDGRYVYKLESKNNTWTCNAVVLAAPYELSGIKLPRELKDEVDVKRTFRKIVATFVRGFLNTSTFGMEPPDAVLTIEGVTEPFTSIGTVWTGNGDEPPIFKVFSSDLLDRKSLERMFKEGAEVLATYPWLAYPNYSPPTEVPNFVSAAFGETFIYTSPLESAGSAMEMSAVSGANAAALLRRALRLRLVVTNDSSQQKEEL